MPQPLLPSLIACAVDVSGDADLGIAEHVVDIAAAWAESFGASLLIMHACPPPPSPVLGPLDPNDVTLSTLAEVLRVRKHHADQELLKLSARAAQRGVKTTTLTITTPGRLPDILADAAVEQKANLLVLGTRGRKGLAARIMGSVAERTAHLSKIPVALLPPD